MATHYFAVAGAPMTAGQRWRKERPTKPGYYWFKIDERLEIVDVPTGEWGELASAYYQGGEWQGPITPHDQEAG